MVVWEKGLDSWRQVCQLLMFVSCGECAGYWGRGLQGPGSHGFQGPCVIVSGVADVGGGVQA